MWITRTSIANPVFATMVMVGITVLGLFSYQRLRVEQMPDVSLPFVMIATAYPGAAPEAVEADVTKPIENAVNQVSGVKRIFSNSREGSSQVFVEFRLSTNAAQATQDVRDKIALVRPGFPKDVKDPLVNRVENENNQPVASLAAMVWPPRMACMLSALPLNGTAVSLMPARCANSSTARCGLVPLPVWP